MDNETKIKLQFQNNVSGDKKLENYTKQLEKIYALTSALSNGKEVKQIETGIKDININVKKTVESSKKLGSTFNNIFNIAKITTFTKVIENLFSKLSSASKKSSDYIENVNLLEVAYKNANESIDESSKRIEDFIDKMSGVYGFDESRLTRQFGIFKQLANAMKLPAEQGEKLSEIMVKMTNDVASLYNLDLERASNALQSALVGQTRPIRGATGADITEKTLQTTADALGLDRQINELSFVEKRLVMVISLTNQLKLSQGDYARTIESASNQIRVMNEQWDRLSRSVGNVFYPILQGIMPYINGILMALTEIFNMLSVMLGFEMPEFDYSNLSSTSDAALDLMEGLEGAGDSVDKLDSKLKGLRSFDKLNVISTPKDTTGVSKGTFVDPKIMEAFNKSFESYDDMMDSVQMKATKIRDSLMKWLGFEKGIDEETGKIVWQYQGIQKTLSNLWESFSKLNPLVKIFVGLGVWKAFKNIWTWGSKLVTVLGETRPIKNLAKMVDYIKVYSAIAKKENTGQNGIIGGIDAWNKNAKAADKFSVALLGTGGVVAGLELTKNAMKDISEEGLNMGNILGLVGGTLSSTFGGAMIGASIGGGWGAIIGGIAGAVIDLGAALFSYESDLTKLVKKSKEALDEVKEKSKEIQKGIADTEMEIASKMSETNYHEKILDELNQITDENGKIKQGYEDRAKYILNELSKSYGVEYELVGNTIKNQDKFNDKIKEAIRLKEQEILLEAYKEDYVQALQRQNELYNDIEKNEKKRAEALQKLDEKYSKYGLTYKQYIELDKKYRNGVKLTEEETKALSLIRVHRSLDLISAVEKEEEAYNNYDKAVKQATKNYEENTNLINRYSDFSAAVQTGNFKEIDKARDEYTKSWVKDGQIMTNSDATEQAKQIETWKATLKEWDRTNDERYKSYKKALTDSSNYTSEITPEFARQWSALGKYSEEEFLQALQQLPADIRQNVVDKMQEQGKGISEELQKGINAKFPEIKITPKLEMPSQTFLSGYVNGLVNGLNAEVIKKATKGVTGKADGGILVNGNWKDITTYATGGLPPIGQMFVARESGPELVGNIGGNTAVMNNDQIVSSVASGVYQAVKSANSTTSQPQIINIYLDKNNKIATYTLDKLNNMAKSNGKIIELGG